MSIAKNSKRPDQQHLIAIGCMAVAAIRFPVEESLIKTQDERVLTLLAVASYFNFQSLIAICILVGLRGQRIRNTYTGLSAVVLARLAALASSQGIFFVSLRFVPIVNAVTLFTV